AGDTSKTNRLGSIIPGYADGMGSVARFYYPLGVAVDIAGNLYVADQNNHAIRKLTPVGTNWVVTTIAGQQGSIGSADGTNSAARFKLPAGVAVDSAGNIYVGDQFNSTIRIIRPAGTNWVVTTLGGLAGNPGSADGTGSAALFAYPYGVAVDSAGNLYVGERNNFTIRKGFPASSVPSPVLRSLSLVTGHFAFAITGLPGLAVEVQSSSDLSNWQVVSTTNVLTGGSNYFAITNPPSGTQFYRAHVR
ncbi:MAG TPA: hypothetical protein VFC07_12890, partial [Verrucomicrobiae bacterium]|nr:hypothetical protein [Verrucomicrobiae bacterium]